MRYRHYCTRCGLTWFDNSPKTKCPDCADAEAIRKEVQANVKKPIDKQSEKH